MQVFKVFCSCFLNPFFLMLAFGFVGLAIFVFFFTSSCCCLIKQVAMLWLFIVCVFVGFLGFVSFGLCFGGFCFFFGGLKGQVRWPKGPPHLALNPPYLFSSVFGLFFGLSFCWFLFFVFCFGFCLFGRVSGSGEVTQRATSLGHKPS